MPVTNGVVAVGTSAVVVCASNQAVLMQNLGTAAVTIGGPGVVVGHGVTLPASMTQPIMVPDLGGALTTAAAEGDPIYGIAGSGSNNVVFLTATWDG
jgi:hypothetical protein